MAVGGIAVNMATAALIDAKISDIRDKLNVNHEIKWTNYKKRRDNGHKAYADLLKELIESNQIHFHMRFQRMQDWDHRRAGPRAKIDTVSRSFYQLVLHRPIRYYGKVADIHVRPDNGSCTKKLHEYTGNLNTDARKHRECGVECIKSIHTVDSQKSNFLQLLDVTLGGLAAVRNKRHERTEVSDHKKELANHIHALWDSLDLSASHPINDKKFNIWNAKPTK